MKIALLGYGVVARGVVQLIEENKELIKQRIGEYIEISYVLVKDFKNDCPYKQSKNIDEIINSDCDVICELIGGIDVAYEYIKKALKKNKHIVTANKALLSKYKNNIEKSLKDEQYFGYEASVAGGIPIIKIIKEGLSANKFISLKAILNGTSNFILTKMQNDNLDYNSALKMAQELGYAEANPYLDVSGFDTAHKLNILASLAYGVDVKEEHLLVQGIENIDKLDFYFAKEFDYCIKLLAIAKENNGLLELRVHPTFISKDNILASVNYSNNAILINDNALGDSLYYGAGAGGKQTASAILSDLMQINIRKNRKMLGYESKSNIAILQKEQIVTKYYLRMKVLDKIGVLKEIASFMSDENISVDSLMQRANSKDEKNIFIITHKASEIAINKLVSKLEKCSFIKDKINLIRIES